MLRPHTNSLRNLICRIDVTALAAVLLVLVTMFLVRPVDVDFKDGSRVDLAEVSRPVSMPKDLREDVMEVAVSRDGVVYFSHNRVVVEAIKDRIRASVRQGAERKVYIRADRRVHYGSVKEIVEAVRSAGIEDIAFVVEHKH